MNENVSETVTNG